MTESLSLWGCWCEHVGRKNSISLAVKVEHPPSRPIYYPGPCKFIPICQEVKVMCGLTAPRLGSNASSVESCFIYLPLESVGP